MPEIEINPTTRIEGHHSTTIDVRDGQIASAKSHVTFSAVNGGACRWTPVLTTRQW